MSDIIFAHKHVEERFVIEMKIVRVRKNSDYPEGIKYSLVVIDRKTAKRILGFDNHERRGHHMHRLGRELPYEFVDEWKLIEDFNKEYDKIKRRSL